jgi:hypothetical protein
MVVTAKESVPLTAVERNTRPRLSAPTLGTDTGHQHWAPASGTNAWHRQRVLTVATAVHLRIVSLRGAIYRPQIQ